MASWWVPVKWVRAPARAGAGVSPTGPVPTTNAVSAQSGFGFIPFSYTNRPPGPLIGQFTGEFGRKDAPTQTQKDLGLAKQATTLALTLTRAAIQAAIQLGAAISSAVTSAIPFVGAAIGAGFAGAQGATAKSDEQRDRAVQQGAVAVISLIPGLGLAAIPMAVEGINDAAQAKERAKATVKEYTRAQKDVQGFLKPTVRASDRLDELHFLVRVGREQQIVWCKESVTVAYDAMKNGAEHLSSAMDIIGNGQDNIGIPGREVGNLRVLVSDATRDAYILYFACRDILSRYSVYESHGPWPYQGKDQTIRGLAGFMGYPNDASRRGIIPGEFQNVKPSGEVYGGVVAPALETVRAYVADRPGWSLWAIIQYFRLADDGRFRSSEFFARVMSSRALETVFAVTPHGESDVPSLPSAEVVTTSIAQSRADATFYERSVQEAQDLATAQWFNNMSSP